MTGDDEKALVLQATIDTIQRTRRTLVVVSTLIGLGLFDLYVWNFSWDHARIVARRAIVETITSMHQNGAIFKGSVAEDDELVATLVKETNQIDKDMQDAKFDVPVVGRKVSVSDYSSGLLLTAAAVLLWLLFYQRRLSACLLRLSQLSG